LLLCTQCPPFFYVGLSRWLLQATYHTHPFFSLEFFALKPLRNNGVGGKHVPWCGEDGDASVLSSEHGSWHILQQNNQKQIEK
jgi:hypothetical protein